MSNDFMTHLVRSAETMVTNVPVLQEWYFVNKDDKAVCMPSFGKRRFLAGRVYNHDDFTAGEQVVISKPLAWCDAALILVTKNGSLYRIGYAWDDYLRMFPDAREKALELLLSLPQLEYEDLDVFLKNSCENSGNLILPEGEFHVGDFETTEFREG